MSLSSRIQGYQDTRRSDSTYVSRAMHNLASHLRCHTSSSSSSPDWGIPWQYIPALIEARQSAPGEGTTGNQNIEHVDAMSKIDDGVPDFSDQSRSPPPYVSTLHRSFFPSTTSPACSDQGSSAHSHATCPSPILSTPPSLTFSSPTTSPRPSSATTSLCGGHTHHPLSCHPVSSPLVQTNTQSTQSTSYGVCKRKYKPRYRFNLHKPPQDPATEFGEAHPCLYPKAVRKAETRVEEDDKDEADAEFVSREEIQAKKTRKPAGRKQIVSRRIVKGIFGGGKEADGSYDPARHLPAHGQPNEPDRSEARQSSVSQATDTADSALTRSISACIEDGALKIFDADGRLVLVDEAPSSATFNCTSSAHCGDEGIMGTPIADFEMGKASTKREALINVRYDSQRSWSAVYGESASSSALATPSPGVEVGRVVVERFIRESFSSVTPISIPPISSLSGLADQQALEEDSSEDSDSGSSFKYTVRPCGSSPPESPLSSGTDAEVTVHIRGLPASVALTDRTSNSASAALDISPVAQNDKEDTTKLQQSSQGQNVLSKSSIASSAWSEDALARPVMNLGRIRTSSILMRRSMRRRSTHIDPFSTAHLAAGVESSIAEPLCHAQGGHNQTTTFCADHEITSPSPAKEEQQDENDVERKDSANPDPPSMKAKEVETTTSQLHNTPEEVPKPLKNAAMLLEQAGRAAQAVRGHLSVSTSLSAEPDGDSTTHVHDKGLSSFETAKSRFEDARAVALQTPVTAFRLSDESLCYFDALEAASMDQHKAAPTLLQPTLEERLEQHLNEQLGKRMKQQLEEQMREKRLQSLTSQSSSEMSLDSFSHSLARKSAESLRTWVPDSFFEAGALLVWYKPERYKKVMLNYYDWAMEMRRRDSVNQYYYDWYLDIKAPSQPFNNAVRCILRNPELLAKLMTSMMSPDKKREILAENRNFLESTAWFQLSIDKPCNILPMAVVPCDMLTVQGGAPTSLSEIDAQEQSTSRADTLAYSSARDGVSTSPSVPEVHIVDLGLDPDDQEQIQQIVYRPEHVQATNSYSTNHLNRTTTERSRLSKWDSGWSPSSSQPQQQQQKPQQQKPQQQEPPSQQQDPQSQDQPQQHESQQPQQQKKKKNRKQKHHQEPPPGMTDILTRLGLSQIASPTRSNYYGIDIYLDRTAYDIPTEGIYYSGTPPPMLRLFGPAPTQAPTADFVDLEYVRQMGRMGEFHDKIRDRLVGLIDGGRIERKRLGVRRRSRMKFLEVRKGVKKVLAGSAKGMAGLSDAGWQIQWRRGNVIDAGYAFAAGHV